MAIHALFKNLFLSGVSQAVRLFANTILFIFIARAYGADGFGSFATAHSFYAFFLLISDFGLETYILTLSKSHQHSERETLSCLFTVKLVLIVFAALSLFILSISLDLRSGTTLLLMLMSIALVGTGLTTFLLAVLKSKELFQQDAKVNVLQNGFLLAAILIVWFFELDIYYLVSAFAGSRFMGLYVLQTSIKKHSSLKIVFVKEIWEKHKKNVTTYGLHLLFGTLFFTSDSLLIPLFYDEQMNGAYQSVFKLAVLALLFSDIMTMTYLPTMSRLFLQDRMKWNHFSIFLQKIISVGGLFAAIIFYFFSEQLLIAIYGNIIFTDSEVLMKIFAGIILIRSSTVVFGFMLTSASSQRTRMKITIYATIGNVIANVIVLPMYGIVGAAFVSLVTNVGVGIMFMHCALALQSVQDNRFIVMLSGTVLILVVVNMASGIILWILLSCTIVIFISVMAQWGFRNHEREYIRSMAEGLSYRLKAVS